MYKCLNPYESDTKTFKNVSYFKNIYKRLNNTIKSKTYL